MTLGATATALACGAHYEPAPAPTSQPKSEAPTVSGVTADGSVQRPVDVPPPRATWSVSTTGAAQDTRIGEPGHTELRMTDRRLTLGAAVATSRGWHAEIGVPLVQRTVGFVNGGRQQSTSVGDVAVGGGRWWSGAPVTVGLHAGVVAPTAPTVRDDDGVALDDDAQPGGGAWAPWFGGIVAGTIGDGAWHIDTVVFVPATSRFGLRPGASVDVEAGGTWTPTPWVTLGAATAVRVSDADRYGDELDPHSGGTVVQLVPSVTLHPGLGLEVGAEAHVPVVDRLRGQQWLGPRWVLSLGWST